MFFRYILLDIDQQLDKLLGNLRAQHLDYLGRNTLSTLKATSHYQSWWPWKILSLEIINNDTLGG